MKNKTFLLAFLLIIKLSLFFAILDLSAETVRSFESPLELKLLKENLEKALTKIDKGNFNEEEETEGFAHLYANGWLSPYDYDIYIGAIFADKAQSIVRIEGDEGDAASIARILDIEGVIQKGSSLREKGKLYRPTNKYHIFAQPLNLISPSLSVLYQSYQSPRLSRKQTSRRAINYFLLDVLAYWLGGNAFFTTGHSPQENRDLILLWLAFNRTAGLVQSFNIVRGHNHLLKFNYSFPIE